MVSNATMKVINDAIKARADELHALLLDEWRLSGDKPDRDVAMLILFLEEFLCMDDLTHSVTELLATDYQDECKEHQLVNRRIIDNWIKNRMEFED